MVGKRKIQLSLLYLEDTFWLTVKRKEGTWSPAVISSPLTRFLAGGAGR